MEGEGEDKLGGAIALSEYTKKATVSDSMSIILLLLYRLHNLRQQ